MKTTLTVGVLCLFMMAAVSAPVMSTVEGMINPPTQENIVQTQNSAKPNFKRDTLKSEVPQIELTDQKVITLEKSNVAVFRGPVTTESVSAMMLEIMEMSNRLPKDKPIYLFIDSPGGSVFDGLSFIDFLKALPQEVHTITNFAASMAFQFVQQLDNRYILPNGMLMSHRARGGVRGQFDGELETRYAMVKRAIDYMDYLAAKRMGLELSDYKKLIKDEYWVSGFDAVADNAADEQTLVKCGKTLNGQKKFTFNSMFGIVEVTFSECPLIRGPLKVDALSNNEEHQKYMKKIFNLMFFDSRTFVNEYIVTNKYKKIFP